MWQLQDSCHSSVTSAAKPSADCISICEIQIRKYLQGCWWPMCLPHCHKMKQERESFVVHMFKLLTVKYLTDRFPETQAVFNLFFSPYFLNFHFSSYLFSSR